MKSTSRASERKEQRRQAILDTASRLFSENGYDSVTLRAIAEELGYAHAALYRYFPDKLSILAEICRNVFAEMLAEVSRLEQCSHNPQDALFAVSRGFVQFCLDHPQHFRAVFLGPENWGKIPAGEYIDAIGRGFFDRLVQVFLNASGSAKMNTETQLLDAHTWWTSLFGTVQVLITSGPVKSMSDGKVLLERQMETLWAGLKC